MIPWLCVILGLMKLMYLLNKLEPVLDDIKLDTAGISARMNSQDWSNFLRFLAPSIKNKLSMDGIDRKAGNLVLKSQEFQQWSEGVPWQLRCYGASGVGKVCIERAILYRA